MQKQIDETANLWNKTKDPKYKKLWYELVNRYGIVLNSFRKSDVSSDRDGNKGNNTRLF